MSRVEDIKDVNVKYETCRVLMLLYHKEVGLDKVIENIRPAIDTLPEFLKQGLRNYYFKLSKP